MDMRGFHKSSQNISETVGCWISLPITVISCFRGGENIGLEVGYLVCFGSRDKNSWVAVHKLSLREDRPRPTVILDKEYRQLYHVLLVYTAASILQVD